jgi:hypothetical protein
MNDDSIHSERDLSSTARHDHGCSGREPTHGWRDLSFIARHDHGCSDREPTHAWRDLSFTARHDYETTGCSDREPTHACRDLSFKEPAYESDIHFNLFMKNGKMENLKNFKYEKMER